MGRFASSNATVCSCDDTGRMSGSQCKLRLCANKKAIQRFENKSGKSLFRLSMRIFAEASGVIDKTGLPGINACDP